MPEGNGPLPLGVVVLTRDEERHLPDCLASVQGLVTAGALLFVLDSESTDQTVAIARRFGARVAVRPFDGYASQRQAALRMVDRPWVLFLDADERLSPALTAEVIDAVRTGSPDVAGYWLPRRNWIRGREMRGGGWWPDYQLRLLRRDRAHYRVGREVHEIVDLDGPAGWLSEPLLHLNYDSLREFRAKQAHYARMRAESLRAAGQFPRRRTYIGQPAREFFRRVVRLRGYRDGPLGLVLAAILAWYELRTWIWVGPPPPPEASSVEPIALPLPEIDLSVVIVSYNVRDLLLDCLTSLEAAFAAGGMTTEIIVVDNASCDGTAEAVRRRFPSVRVVEAGANRGFAAGCNMGIRLARGRAIALLNPDTTVVGDALGTLARYLEEHPDVGVAGPRVYRPDGTTQPTRRRFPTLATGLLESTIIQDYWKNNRVLRRYYVADRSDDEEQEVDWLVGACLVARREAVEMAGLLDERFFMYSEEVEWCRRIREAGWMIMYVPSAAVTHYEGASSSQDIPARQVDFDTSKVLLFERLYGRGVARFLRAFLLASYLVRVVIEGAKGLAGHKPELRRARVALYLRAFRSRLRPGRRLS
nr:MAG: hypothetical protein DIU58_06950 [Sphaerobacter thermophilus]